MNQQNLFKPLTEQSKAAVVETVNALVELIRKNPSPHLLTAYNEYYIQLATLAHESSVVERQIQEDLARDFEEEERKEEEVKRNDRITDTKSDV